VHAGTVSFAAPFAGFGTLVIVDHGGDAFTLYGHLRESAVTAGAQLERGAVVGRTGRTPEGTEAIYFEVRIDGRAVNPLLWLRAAHP
jgi:septal ring factor EnvC (AmiA/AmiB activator)